MAEAIKLPPGATLVSGPPMKLPPGAALVSPAAAPPKPEITYNDPSPTPAGPGLWQRIVNTTKNAASGIDPAALEVSPDESMGSRIMKGIGRAGYGIATMPGQIARAAMSPPETPDDMAALAMGGQGVLAGKRMIADPAAAMGKKAYDAWQQGHVSEAAGYGAAAALPMFGPMAAGLGERAGSGDIAGAAAEAGTLALLPKVASGASRLVAGTLERGSAPFAGRMNTVPQGVPATESFTPAEIKGAAAEHGVPMSAAEVLGKENAGPLRSIQNVGDKGMLTRGISEKHYSQVRGALSDWSQNLLDRIHPQPGDAGSTGGWLQGQLQKALDAVHDDAAQDFAEIDKKTKGFVVDTKPVQEWAKSKLIETDPARKAAPTLDPKKATSILENMSGLGDVGGRPQLDFSTAQQIRSRLWKVGNIPSDVIPEQAQAWAREATGVLDQAMMEAARRAGPTVEGDFRVANAKWKDAHEKFATPGSPIYQAMREADPAKAPQKFLQSGAQRGSVKAIEDLQNYVPNIEPLRRELVRSVIDPKGNGPEWNSMYGRLNNRYSDAFLQKMFGSDQAGNLADLRKMSRVAKNTIETADRENPSRTSHGNSELADASAFIGAATGYPAALAIPLGKLAAAKASYSPGIAGYLTRDAVSPSIVGIANAIRKAGPIGLSAGTYAARSATASKR